MASSSFPQSDTKDSGLKHDISGSCTLKYVAEEILEHLLQLADPAGGPHRTLTGNLAPYFVEKSHTPRGSGKSICEAANRSGNNWSIKAYLFKACPMATAEVENGNISPTLARGWSKIRGAVDPGWDVMATGYCEDKIMYAKCLNHMIAQ
ncbi:hypothetical protein MG293_003049 [Ovis ammon polii]|uniref:Uncharacterized protein n=1 Tax=Ovis ammon polii TaxID=230172 RepID=A0AAD4UKQ5_OVIAM|nr:hypothetical protein MG293_003049 [Ovis ammon polii]KAI4576720.1 hypothetical protein MJT46_002555 [Ovis ammon polii x Ovis aries]